MSRLLGRRIAALYSTLFLLAAAAAPHHHLNGLEDLLLNERSDSGKVVVTPESADPADTVAPEAVAVVDDVPCLACFCNDFVAAPSSVVRVTITLEPVASGATALDPAIPTPAEREGSSRAPPLRA